MVVMKLGVHESSQNRRRRHDLPTPGEVVSVAARFVSCAPCWDRLMKTVLWPRSGRGRYSEVVDGWSGGDGAIGGPTRVANEKQLDEAEKYLSASSSWSEGAPTGIQVRVRCERDARVERPCGMVCG
jgi:hypothetical protein